MPELLSPMLGLTLAEPLLMWGAAAAAGPVVLHFLMRTRAPTVVFPALRFVLMGKAGQSGYLKLKHLLLLLLRMGALALLAFVLSWPSCESQTVQTPVLAVMAFDNSASMEYRVDGVTRLELARRRALQLAEGLPPGSEIAVLDLARLSSPAVWQALPVTEGTFSPVKPVGTAGAVAPLVRAGLESLRERREPGVRRRLYIFTDRTAHSWREPISPISVDDVDVVLVDCSVAGREAANGERPMLPDAADSAGATAATPAAAASDRNFAVTSALTERDPVPEGQAISVSVGVRAAADRSAVRVSVQWDGRPPDAGVKLGSFRPLAATPPVRGEISGLGEPPDLGRLDELTTLLSQSGLPAGLHTGRVVLEADDPLAIDNAVYFSVTVSRPFRVLFVYGVEGSAGSGNPEGVPHRILPEMVEPSSRPRSARRSELIRRPVEGGWLDELDASALLVLFNTGPLSPAQWDRVERFVRNGGRLWMLLGGRTTGAEFAPLTARGLLPVRVREPYRTGTGAPPSKITPSHPSSPTLRSFAGGGLGDLASLEVSRFWMLEPTDKDTERWADLRVPDKRGAMMALPAILHRKVERGRVLLWTFGPQRSWSNMQDFVPEWPLLVQETVTELLDTTVGRAKQYPLGEPVRWQLSEKLTGRDVEWGRVSADAGLPRKLKVGPLGLVDFGVPEEPGNYRVRLPTLTGTPEEAAFSVNLPVAETLMQPQSLDWLRLRFPLEHRERLRLLSAGRDEADPGPTEQPLAGHLALILLLLLVAESFFANRFYRDEGDAAGR